MLNNLVRVVLEKDSNDFMELRVSNLSSFIAAFGEDLLTAFCCCHIQADRFVSLVYFNHAADKYEISSVASHRNHNTFLFLAFGIFRELTSSLENLNKMMIKRKVFDRETWVKGLGRWCKYGKKHHIINLRNKVIFHVDFDVVQKGLQKVASSNTKFSILESEKGYVRKSKSNLAMEALLQGTDLSIDDIEELVKEFSELVSLKNELDSEFLRVLKVLNLEPIQVFNRTKK